MEMTPAFRHYLLDITEVRGIVGADGVYTNKLYKKVDGTGKRAIVVRDGGGWTVPNTHNTAEFPLLTLDIWADVSRDSKGDPLRDDAEHNTRAVYRVVDKHLHLLKARYVGGRGSDPGMYVIDLSRWSEPVVAQEPQFKVWPAYDMALGEAAVLSVQYALTGMH